jgi:flagellar biosynthetic protein FlhB
MPEKPASERTEEATPERLRKARQEGQVPQSQEVPSALMIGALLLALGMFGSETIDWLTRQVRDGVSVRPASALGSGQITAVMQQKAGSALAAVTPFLAIAAGVSIISSLVSSGWAFSPKAIHVRFDRISPTSGLKRLFSTRSLVKLLLSLLKLAVLVGIVYAFLSDKVGLCMSLRWTTPAGTLVGMSRLVFGLLGRIMLGILVIAGIDLLWQRRKHKRELRMTRQEVKEERRQYEQSPEVKARIRAIQIQMVRKRMLQEVPNADVVLVNPTHVAVALKYQAGSMDAPQMLAKGADVLCEKIKEIARAHNVPIVHRPELARTIYAAVEVGQPIPEVLFVAVAEVLAMIYRLRRQRIGN